MALQCPWQPGCYVYIYIYIYIYIYARTHARITFIAPRLHFRLKLGDLFLRAMSYQTVRARQGVARIHLAALEPGSATLVASSKLQTNGVLELLGRGQQMSETQRAQLGTMAATLQLCPTDLTSIMSALAGRPAGDEAAPKAAKQIRREGQDLMPWDSYVSSDEWDRLLDKTINRRAKQQLLIEIVVGRLWGINPTEDSMKWLASCSHALSHDAAQAMRIPFEEKIEHREWVKKAWRTRARKFRQPLEYFDCLPADPSVLAISFPHLHDHVFGQLEGNFVASRLPSTLATQINGTYPTRGAGQTPAMRQSELTAATPAMNQSQLALLQPQPSGFGMTGMPGMDNFFGAMMQMQMQMLRQLLPNGGDQGMGQPLAGDIPLQFPSGGMGQSPAGDFPLQFPPGGRGCKRSLAALSGSSRASARRPPIEQSAASSPQPAGPPIERSAASSPEPAEISEERPAPASAEEVGQSEEDESEILLNRIIERDNAAKAQQAEKNKLKRAEQRAAALAAKAVARAADDADVATPAAKPASKAEPLGKKSAVKPVAKVGPPGKKVTTKLPLATTKKASTPGSRKKPRLENEASRSQWLGRTGLEGPGQSSRGPQGRGPNCSEQALKNACAALWINSRSAMREDRAAHGTFPCTTHVFARVCLYLSLSLYIYIYVRTPRSVKFGYSGGCQASMDKAEAEGRKWLKQQLASFNAEAAK